MTAAELVERVALKAIPGSSHEECCRIARAAIAETLAAIREPTAAMITEGLLEILPNLPSANADDVLRAWCAMIDALAAEIREQSK